MMDICIKVRPMDLERYREIVEWFYELPNSEAYSDGRIFISDINRPGLEILATAIGVHRDVVDIEMVRDSDLMAVGVFPVPRNMMRESIPKWIESIIIDYGIKRPHAHANGSKTDFHR